MRVISWRRCRSDLAAALPHVQRADHCEQSWAGQTDALCLRLRAYWHAIEGEINFRPTLSKKKNCQPGRPMTKDDRSDLLSRSVQFQSIKNFFASSGIIDVTSNNILPPIRMESASSRNRGPVDQTSHTSSTEEMSCTKRPLHRLACSVRES